MSLIKCKECQHQVSDKANICPSCGVKISKNFSAVQMFGILFLGLFVFYYFDAQKEKTVIREPITQITTQESVTQIATPEPIVQEPVVDAPTVQKNTIQAPVTQTAIQVSSIQIANDYEQNEARADSLYKGKLLHVTGIIISISKDFTDNTVVNLGTTNEFNNVHAELEKSEEQKAINLQKGNEITVQCQGSGEVVSSPMLNKCIFISSSEKTDITTPLKQPTVSEQPNQSEIPVLKAQQSEPEPTIKTDKNKTWTGDWGNGIIATVSSQSCGNIQLINQDYDYLMTVTIPIARLKTPTDAWQVLGDRAVTITGCWSKRDEGMIHAKLTRKKGNKIWEQDFKLDDGNWINK